MSSSPVKRKLSAILAADAVGYSRMMGANEEATLKTLSAHRAVIDGIIEFHDGRIVGTAGDSVLAEFGSPVEAVRCAVEIQDALRTRNDSLPEDRRLQFRVGVNLGDVMIKGNDLLGDGVNVAARLEGIAEPGGICISASVYDLIRGKLDLGFHDIGEQSLKNIEHPIRVYRVARDGGVPPGSVRKARRKDGRGRSALVGLGAVVVAAAAGYGYLVWLPQQRAAAEADLARAAAEAEAAKRQAAAAGATAEQAQRALEAERAAVQKAKADAEVARARAQTEAAKRRAETQLAAATRARDQAQREAEAAKAAARKAAEEAAAEKAAAERAAAQKLAAMAAAKPPPAPAPVPAPAAAAPHRYDGVWSGSIVCEPANGQPERTFGLHASASNDVFALRHGHPGKPGFLALRGSPDAEGRLVLLGKGLSGRLSGHPGTPIRARFEGRFENDRYEGNGNWGRRSCSAKLAR
jgi:class 3 adenylate cyclase